MSGKWRKLLIELSKELTDKDIEELKFSLEIPAGVAQGLKTSLQLFKYLEGRGEIVQNDITSLIDLFKDLDNEKLLRMVKSFANDNTPATLNPSEDAASIDSRSVYVGNVDYSATKFELEQHFHGCGSVNRVTIPCDSFTGRPKGFAYVEFGDKESADNAVELTDSLFKGRQIKVSAKRTNVPGMSSTNCGHRDYTNHESCPSVAPTHVAPRVQQPRVQPPRPQQQAHQTLDPPPDDSSDVPDAAPSHAKCEGIHLCIIFFFGEEDKTTNAIIQSTFKGIGFQVSNIYKVDNQKTIVKQIKHFGAKGDYDSVVIFLLRTPTPNVFHVTCKALNNAFKKTVPRILFEWQVVKSGDGKTEGGDGKTDTTEPFPKTHRLKLLTKDKSHGGSEFMEDVCKIVSQLPTLDKMWSWLQTSYSSTATPTGNLRGSYRIGSSTNFIFKNSAIEATLAASDPVSAEMVFSE